MSKFSWIPVFKAMSDWLAGYEDRQEELVNILELIGVDKGLTDENEQGEKIPLTEIDPFTFFSMFMKYGQEKSVELFAALISLIELDTNPPTEFNGVPSAQAMRIWLFPYKKDRKPEMISTLWKVFHAARDKTLDAELFNKALKIPNTGFSRLTEGLFYAFPDEYLPINRQTKTWLPRQKIDLPGENWNEYQHCVNAVRNQFTEPFAELSHRAYLENMATRFNAKVAIDYLQGRFPNTSSGTTHIIAFRCSNGRELAFDPGNDGTRRTIKVFVSSLPDNQGLVGAIRHYPANKSRNNHLKQHASSLAVGNEAWSVSIKSQDQLEQLCDWYSGEIEQVAVKTKKSEITMESQPLNQILYGPPGTGKTFATTEIAVKIADPDWHKQNLEESNEQKRHLALKTHYDQLVSQGRIVFTTFHQSFAYEDFIEGIRASSDETTKELSYPVIDGVFKDLVINAEKSIGSGQQLGLSDSPRVWKISIDYSGPSAIRDYCFKQGEARIGWGDTGDLSLLHEDRTSEQKAYWDGLSSTDRNSIDSFAETMEVGDVVLCLKDKLTIQAVGVVTSDYWFDKLTEEMNGKIYPHVRSINWLFDDLDLNILSINDNTQLTQKTVYPLARINWDSVLNLLNSNGKVLDIKDGEKPNFVLIIDEINRGNIARIFGELITLLEPSKRKGGDDARHAILPYSKEPFCVPSNVYVIGTMNTADRSLATLDLALRRRFSFIDVPPSTALLTGVEVHGLELANLLNTINERIEVLLDRDHMIGHSYFLGLTNLNSENEKASELARVFKEHILPLLQEYFFDDWERIGWVLNDPSKPKEDQFIVQGGSQAIGELFGSVIGEQLNDRRFQINKAAFKRSSAYQGIVSSSNGDTTTQ